MAPVIWPLSSMLLTQIAATLATAAVPVLATEIATTTGLRASLIGVYTAILFFAAILVSSVSGHLVRRFGPVRTNQLGLVMSAGSVLLALVANPLFILLTAIGVGMGYGPNTPSGSEVLARTTPSRMRGLVFSIKQSGSPLGGLIGGVMLPFVVGVANWRYALMVTAALVIVVALAVQPLRNRVDISGKPDTPATGHSPIAALKLVLGTGPLRALTMGALALVAMHSCFQSFTVAFLVEGVELTLTKAGVLFAVLQTSGAVSRVVLGWLVDRMRCARSILMAIAALGLMGSGLTAMLSPQTGYPVLVMVCALAGLGSSGWYGVFLSEIARHAPDGRVGFTTGGALSFIYIGLVAGPLAFSAVVGLAGSYVPAFWMLGGLGALAAWCFSRMDDGKDVYREDTERLTD